MFYAKSCGFISTNISLDLYCIIIAVLFCYFSCCCCYCCIQQLKIIHFALSVLQVNAEHSYAMMTIFNQDVIEDLFETHMKNNAYLRNHSGVCCFQSTQVSRSDVADGTNVIQPDFPLSPLKCPAPAMPLNYDSTSPAIHSAGGLCSKAEMLTVTAAHSRPTATVTDCTEAQVALHLESSQSSHVTFPSAVYDRVRNFLFTSDSEVNQNRLSDTFSSNTASDNRQKNRRDDELVTEAAEIICTTAVSCNGDFSPLDSSYVDAGRMAYTESDANVLSKVSVVNAVAVPVITTGIENNMSELCITNVCSLRNNVDIATIDVLSNVNAADMPVMPENNTSELRITNVYSLCNNVDVLTSSEVAQSIQSPRQAKSSFSSSSSNIALQGGQDPCTKIKLRSPTDNTVTVDPLSGSKRKRSLHKDNVHESDVLFKKAKKTKLASKRRQLYKDNMLMGDSIGEESQDCCTDVHFSVYNDVGAHMHRGTDSETVVSRCEILQPTLVPAGLPAPTSVTAGVSAHTLVTAEYSSNAAIGSVTDAVTSCQNLVEVTRVEFDAVQLALRAETDLNAQHVASVSHSMPLVLVNHQPQVSLEHQMQDVQHGQAVAGEPSGGIEIESDVATIVSTSTLSPAVPSCTVSRSIASVSVLNPTVHVTSVKWPSSLNSPCSSQILTDDKRPSNCVTDELLDSVECRTDIAVENNQPEVTDNHLPLCLAERHGTDSAVAKLTLSTETSSEMLSVVVSESCHSPVVAHDESRVTHSSPLYPSTDAITGNCQKYTPETNKASVCVSSVSNTHSLRTDPMWLPAVDNTDIARRALHRSRSLNEISCQSSSSTTDLKSVSVDSTVDLVLCNSFMNKTGTVKDRDNDWYSQNKKCNLSRKKFQRQTSMVSRAGTSITDHNKNDVTISKDMNDNRGLTSETPSRESTNSAAELCILSQSTDESNSQSLLCGQKQSGGSYCLPNVTVSVHRLSAVGTPFLPSHSCSLECRERCRIAEESLGYHPPLTKANDIVSCMGCNKDQLMQSERISPCNSIPNLKLTASTTCGKEQCSKVSPVALGMSDVYTSADAAAISGTETESKLSSSVPSNGSSKLTLPTPKNSLTCYQPANSLLSTAPASDSDLVSAESQVQPNFSIIQVLIFLHI